MKNLVFASMVFMIVSVTADVAAERPAVNVGTMFTDREVVGTLLPEMGEGSIVGVAAKVRYAATSRTILTASVNAATSTLLWSSEREVATGGVGHTSVSARAERILHPFVRGVIECATHKTSSSHFQEAFFLAETPTTQSRVVQIYALLGGTFKEEAVGVGGVGFKVNVEIHQYLAVKHDYSLIVGIKDSTGVMRNQLSVEGDITDDVRVGIGVDLLSNTHLGKHQIRGSMFTSYTF